MHHESLASIGRAMRAMDAHYLTVSIERDMIRWQAAQARYRDQLTRVCSSLGPDALLAMLRVVDAALDAYEDMNWGDRPESIEDAKVYLARIAGEREFADSDEEPSRLRVSGSTVMEFGR